MEFSMKFLIVTTVLFSLSAFAADVSLDCKKLISGNANGKAYTTGKSIDATVTVSEQNEDAEVRGTMVMKAGEYNREGDVDNIYAFFTDGKKFKKSGDVVTITSFDRNLIMCGMTQSPCRHWEEMTINLKTLEGVLEKSHSNNAYFGDRTYSLSVKFSCKKI
jgi:hypothetical protein